MHAWRRGILFHKRSGCTPLLARETSTGPRLEQGLQAVTNGEKRWARFRATSPTPWIVLSVDVSYSAFRSAESGWSCPEFADL
jgi:hypothetical protein